MLIDSPLQPDPREWFALRDLKPYNSKHPAFKILLEMGLDVFTPMHWVVCQSRAGKKQRIYRPVISDLLFVHESRAILDPLVASIDKLQYRYKKGAGPQTAITVPAADMQRFISAVDSDQSALFYTPAELTSDMIGKEILINGGPMDGYRGRLLKMRGSKKRRLIVQIPGFVAAAVEVSPDFIQIIN